MTVIVATAYMEEAERFEYLVAMDGGRVLVGDTSQNVLARAGAATLEQAYVSLLPDERRAGIVRLFDPPYETSGGDPAIEARGLTRRFGDFVAVDDVSFHIGRGEIFGFLGSNGCGKTTTMKMLTGLLDASSGSAKLLGQPIEAGDMETRLRVGYMSQSFSLYEELTARQNLMLHARLYRVRAKRRAGPLVEAALADFALGDHADALPAALPLGIRQRLQLAAACLHAPEVLILDEPTSGVDPGARDMFWRHLIELSRQTACDHLRLDPFHERGGALRPNLADASRAGIGGGRAAELTRRQQAATLEDAFISYLEQAEGAAGAPARARRASKASGREVARRASGANGRRSSTQFGRGTGWPACGPSRVARPSNSRAIKRVSPSLCWDRSSCCALPLTACPSMSRTFVSPFSITTGRI